MKYEIVTMYLPFLDKTKIVVRRRGWFNRLWNPIEYFANTMVDAEKQRQIFETHGWRPRIIRDERGK